MLTTKWQSVRIADSVDCL